MDDILLAMIVTQPHRDPCLETMDNEVAVETIAAPTPLSILRVLDNFSSSKWKTSVWLLLSKYFSTKLGSLLPGQIGVSEPFFRVNQDLRS